MNYKLMENISIALWLGFAALLVYQAEEYHWPGTFPDWINKIFYKNRKPVRYPADPRSSFIINVLVEWTTFILAAILAEDALWLGIAVMIFAFGNFVKHAFYYNIKAHTWYNPGMISSIVCFLPVSAFFFLSVIGSDEVAVIDYLIGIPMGIFFTTISSVEVIGWWRTKHTRWFHFSFM